MPSSNLGYLSPWHRGSIAQQGCREGTNHASLPGPFVNILASKQGTHYRSLYDCPSYSLGFQPETLFLAHQFGIFCTARVLHRPSPCFTPPRRRKAFRRERHVSAEGLVVLCLRFQRGLVFFLVRCLGLETRLSYGSQTGFVTFLFGFHKHLLVPSEGTVGLLCWGCVTV